jgi:hypothetical protein
MRRSPASDPWTAAGDRSGAVISPKAPGAPDTGGRRGLGADNPLECRASSPDYEVVTATETTAMPDTEDAKASDTTLTDTSDVSAQRPQ